MNEPRASEERGSVAIAWLWFALAFFCVVLAVRALAPHGSGLERMDVKLDAFAQRKDEFNVVFIGSSRTVRGFVPAQFDAQLAERGVSVRSFNFGVAGARLPEMLYVLERVAELRPKALKYVFVDPEDFELVHDTRNALAQAGILWHDPRTTWEVTRALLSSERDDNVLPVLLDHGEAFALNALNVGRTARWVNLALGRRADAGLVAETLGERADGHTALYDDQETLRGRRRRFERSRDEFERMVANYRTQARPEQAAQPQFVEMLQRFERRVRELGATPIFVIQPALTRQWDLVQAAESGAIEALLRYDEPERHPELFAHHNRFDSLHLNDAGAAHFTRALGDDFVAWLAAREDARR